MKKLIALLMALAMLLCMAACSNEKKKNSSDNSIFDMFDADKDPISQKDLQYYQDHIRSDVYWTKTGTGFHTNSDCYHLANNQELITGSLKEAFEAGKNRPCKTCLKIDDIPTYEEAIGNGN